MKIDLLAGSVIKEPQIWWFPEACIKMRSYIAMYNEEISWLGLVERRSENNFMVRDVFLVKQECSGATTEMDKQAQNELYLELVNSNVITMENQANVGLFLWGHSHHTMGTGPSGQDNKQMQDFMQNRPDGFYIRQISNKRDEHNLELYMFKEGLVIRELPMLLYISEEIAFCKSIKEDIDRKVSKFRYTPPTTPYPGYTHYQSSRYRERGDGAYNQFELEYGAWWDEDRFNAIQEMEQKAGHSGVQSGAKGVGKILKTPGVKATDLALRGIIDRNQRSLPQPINDFYRSSRPGKKELNEGRVLLKPVSQVAYDEDRDKNPV